VVAKAAQAALGASNTTLKDIAVKAATTAQEAAADVDAAVKKKQQQTKSALSQMRRASQTGGKQQQNARHKLKQIMRPSQVELTSETIPKAKKPKLIGKGPRGSTLTIVSSVTYDARNEYGWDDVCRQGDLIMKGKLKVSRCNDTDENGERKWKVNSSTMKRWAKDDFEAMKLKGKKGVHGKPHWYVEKHTRRRNSLSKPGPGPTLGKAEDVLCVKFARGAKVMNALIFFSSLPDNTENTYIHNRSSSVPP